jgi:hypothetical protein
LQEWSRLLERHQQSGLSPQLRGLLNEISTNTLSLLDSFRAASMSGTSVVFKASFVAVLLASLCAVVGQGAVTLLILPSFTNQMLTIPRIIRDLPIQQPWSATQNLAPLNGGMITVGKQGAHWTYLEQIVGANVADIVPEGYLVPIEASITNRTIGRQYPTDVARIQCECSWVAPTLPPATNDTYIVTSLDDLGITGFQRGPNGVVGTYFDYKLRMSLNTPTEFAPISNMTFASNSTSVTSGLFAWTLWYVG